MAPNIPYQIWVRMDMKMSLLTAGAGNTGH